MCENYAAKNFSKELLNLVVCSEFLGPDPKRVWKWSNLASNFRFKFSTLTFATVAIRYSSHRKVKTNILGIIQHTSKALLILFSTRDIKIFDPKEQEFKTERTKRTQEVFHNQSKSTKKRNGWLFCPSKLVVARLYFTPKISASKAEMRFRERNFNSDKIEAFKLIIDTRCLFP